MTLGEMLHLRSADDPTNTVLSCGEETVTWDALDRFTSQLAGWFLDQGMRSGDRVAIHWSNRIEAVQLLFGVFRAGLVAVPINTRLKPPEIAYILNHSQARLCFSEPALAQLAEEAGVIAVIRALPRLEPSDTVLPQVHPDQPAAIMYTSGTTARPKGVTHTHRTLMETNQLVVESFRLDKDDITLLTTPVMHASGLYCCLLPTMYCGGSVVLVPTFQPAAILDGIQHSRATYSGALPAFLHMLAEEQASKPRDVGSVKTLVSAGDSVPVSLQARVQSLFGMPLQELYGLTESLPLTFNPQEAIRPGSIGKATPGVELRIVDAEGRDVPDGTVGELAVRSPGNCVGYWNDVPATEALLRDGWLHTGDLTMRDGDGYFWFKGRKKEIIIRGGSNISPQEVEDALYHHPSVREVGVIGMPDPIFGERVVAFVAVRAEDAPSEMELIEFARQRLADYKAPEWVVFLPQLPKGLTGKVQRRALREMLGTQPGIDERSSAAGT